MFHFFDSIAIVDMDVGDLVVGDGEGGAFAGVEQFTAEFFSDREKPMLAQDAIEVDRLTDLGDPVLGEEDDRCATRGVVVNQLAADCVELGEIGLDARVGGAELLQAIVEVGKVDEGEGGIVGAIDLNGGVGDPLGGFDAGGRSPEIEEWELAELLLELGAKVRGMGPDVGELQAAGGVHGARGNGVIGGGIHRVPPADIGAGERWILRFGDVPDFGLLDEGIRLLPEFDFRFIAEVPAVGDDAVIGGPLAGEVGGLNRGGDGGNDRADGGEPGGFGKGEEARGGGADEAFGQADGVDDDGFVHLGRDNGVKDRSQLRTLRNAA